MSETTPLIKAALNLKVGAGFDVYDGFRSGIPVFILPESWFLTARIFKCTVFGIVDGIIWLIAGLPLGGILTADNRFGQVVAVLVLAELEPFMLDDAGSRGLTVGVVDGGVALKARLFEQLILKPDGAILQRAEFVGKVGINGAGVNNLISQCVQRVLVLEVIGVQPHIDAVQKVGPPSSHLSLFQIHQISQITNRIRNF